MSPSILFISYLNLNSPSSSMLVGCGEEEESESMSMPPKLPLLSFTFPVRSPGHEDASSSSSGSSTPPFHSSASVPFKWEEEPGKPINHCTALIPFAQPLPSLHLIPPPSRSTTTKTPSPTTVLDGPPSPETGLLGPMVMMMSHSEQQNKSITKKKKKRLFGSWPWGSRRSAGNCNKMVVVGERDNKKGLGLGGSFVFSSSSSTAAFSFSRSLDDVGRECCSEYGGESECAVGESAAAVKQMRKSRSFINFAQVMPWKAGSKSRKHATST